MIKAAEKYLGVDVLGKHRLVNYYNANCLPLVDAKRKYRMTYNDNWCAMFTSVVAQQSGLGPDVFPYEVSVMQQLKWAQDNARFTKQVSDVAPGDLILYNWKRNGHCDHVGIVVSKGDEAARLKWEQVARQVGETDFRRDPRTGEYLDPGVAMDWRIHAKAKGHDYISVIEGNKSDTVGYRYVSLPNTQVWGFIKVGPM